MERKERHQDGGARGPPEDQAGRPVPAAPSPPPALDRPASTSARSATRTVALDRGFLLPNTDAGTRVLDRAALLRQAAGEKRGGGGGGGGAAAKRGSSASEDSQLLGQQQQQQQQQEVNVAELEPERAVNAGEAFVSNHVITSRYTVFNFLPKNLYEQFQNVVNIYFLFVGVLQAIPATSTTEGIPSIYLPLMFVLFVSAVRAAFEDRQRHKADREENGREYEVFRRGPGGARSFRRVASHDIVVGDVVRVPSGAQFPADLLFLHSSNPQGICFVETANIDGETNLKVKVAPHVLHELFVEHLRRTASDLDAAEVPEAELARRLEAFEAMVMMERPNGKLDQFNGWVGYTPAGAPQRELVRLEAANLLLRGTRLQNTQHVYGVAVYTGDDTKVRRNASKQRNLLKIKSSVLKRVERYLVGMLALQMALCLLGGIFAGVWHSQNKGEAWYLDLAGTGWEEGAVRFFTWFIILSQFVPISLLVTGEFVKTFQTFFMNRDVTMFSNATNKRAVVQTLQLNEDLGQVEYIFSDKTGTLTCNVMEFRVAVLRGKRYGDAETEIAKRVKARTGGGDRAPRRPWSEMEAEIREREEALHDLAFAAPPGAGKRAASRSASAGGTSLRRSSANNGTPPRASPGPAASPTSSAAAVVAGDAVQAQHPFVNFSLPHREEILRVLWGGRAEDAEERRWLRLMLTHLAISNTITPVEDGPNGEVSLQASSPDELALCSFAQFCGFSFVQRNPVVVEVDALHHAADGAAPEREEYEFLANLDFNSRRKRSTAVYERNGRVLVMSKGADSVMFEIFRQGSATPAAEMDELEEELGLLSNNGLRTLVLGHAELDPAWWAKWKGEYEFVRSLPERGDEANHTRGACRPKCRICACYNNIEVSAGMHLLSATAIDDGLQPLVPEAIEDFLDAGIKVWMLTGDKLETAKNIGMACNLIDPGTEVADPGRWLENRLLPVTAHLADLHRLEDAELRPYYESVFARAVQATMVAQARGAAAGPTYEEQFVAFLEELQLDVSPSAGEDDEDSLLQVPRAAVLDAVVGAGLEAGRRETCTFEHFSWFVRAMEITVEQAAHADLRRGHMALARHKLNEERRPSRYGTASAAVRAKAECSLVVEGRALGVLYPPSLGLVQLAVAEDGAGGKSKKKKKKKKKSRRRKSRRRVESSGSNAAAAADGVELQEVVPGHDARVDEDAPPDAMSASQRAETMGMQDRFFDLASMCKSVVACRLTPYQKAQMIADVQARKNALTLAIGDGANDEPMIHTADVGVGIQGLEGSAAANAADYAIGQFRFLHTLLFVHGYWSYNRLCKMVVYIFYKTVMMRLVMYMYGFVSGFSGEQFYSEYVALYYNVAMTAVPVMVMSTLDQRLSRQTLQNEPKAYASISNGAIFNGRYFAGWIVRALLDAVAIFVIGYGALGINDVGQSDGLVHGRWVTSTTMYFTTVAVATFRITLEFNSVTWIHQLFVWLSFFGSYAVCLFMTSLPESVPSLYGVMQRSAGTPSAWLSLLLTVSVSLLTGFGWMAYHREVNPSVSDVLQEQERGGYGRRRGPSV